MRVDGSRVGIVGGSIAGCAAAIALIRAGCEVTVYERSRGELKDRGTGILIPQALRQVLIDACYLDAGYPIWNGRVRDWLLCDGDRPTGRVLWRQTARAATNNWGVLWRSLRSQVADACYQDGTSITGFDRVGSEWLVHHADGPTQAFDVIVGADGYRSRIRALLHPDSQPGYAGYVLWRGTYDESRVSDRTWWDAAADAGHWWTVCFPGGHGVLYPIPGFDGRIDAGHRRVNWAIYCAAPEGTRFEEPGSLAPGSIARELVASLDLLLDEHFPPYIAKLIRLTGDESLLIQPIYDQLITTYVADGVLLIGDASTVTRPHTGSGATKALQDAIALERVCAQSEIWAAALAAYDAERCTAGIELVELGRRIGRHQVQRTPDWAAMTAKEMDAWTKATLSGQKLYFYGNSTAEDRD